MARPSRLRLLDEREVPDRPEDLAASAIKVVPAPVEMRSSQDAEAIIAELRAQVAVAQNAAAEARNNQQTAEQTVEALRKTAVERINAAEQQRDAAVQAASAKTEERQQSRAVATAVSLGLVRQIAGEFAKIFAWLPSLGALLGGFWLFDRSLAAPSPQTLVALALYGAVVVAPAVMMTLRGKT